MNTMSAIQPKIPVPSSAVSTFLPRISRRGTACSVGLSNSKGLTSSAFSRVLISYARLRAVVRVCVVQLPTPAGTGKQNVNPIITGDITYT